MTNHTTDQEASLIRRPEHLEDATIPVRLKTSQFGDKKAFSVEQREETAATFKTKKERVSGQKKLLDKKNPLLSAVLKVIRDAREYWKSVTLPFGDERGIRLLRKSKLDEFNTTMNEFVATLREKVSALDFSWDAIVETNSRDLADLSCPDDFPDNILGEFSIAWDFPEMTPNDELKELAPALFEQELDLYHRQFSESLHRFYFDQFKQLLKLVVTIDNQIMATSEEGAKFSSACIRRLQEWITNFNATGIVADTTFSSIVEEADIAVGGVEPAEVTKDASLREAVGRKVHALKARLEPFARQAGPRFDDDDEF